MEMELTGRALWNEFKHAVENSVYVDATGKTKVGEPANRVARKMDVSHMTVYNILNDPTKGVSDRVAAKMRAYVRDFYCQREALTPGGAR